MRIKFTKPRDGFTTITLDDRRGMTGMRIRVGKVAIEDLAEKVGEAESKWRSRRDALLKARSPASP